jgi:integrase/recombinase XerD
VIPAAQSNWPTPWIERTLTKFSSQRRLRIEKFIQDLELRALTKDTIERYLQAIITLDYDGKAYENLTQEDLTDWIRSLHHRYRSERTQEMVKIKVKHFLRWIHNGNDHDKPLPEHLYAIKVRKIKPRLDRDVLTHEEIRGVLDTCDSQRDRTLIFTTYESGCRAGELLSLRIRDVDFDRYGAVIRVRGKTGERRMRLIESVPDLQLWLSMHPNKDDTEAPLWPSKRSPQRNLTLDRFERMLSKYAKLAGIEKKKHIHPHLLRHSRATHLANVLTEAQMREFFGWTKASDMPSIYVHLSGRDVDATLLKHYGVNLQEPKQPESALKPKSCPRCSHENPAAASFCMRCSMPLDSRIAMEIEDQLQVKERAAERVADNEIVATVIAELIQRSPGLLAKIIEERGLRSEIKRIGTWAAGCTPANSEV